MKVLIFGLPGSGKSFLANELVKLLGDQVAWFNADKVREEASRLLRHYPSQYDMMYIDESFEPLERIDYE